MKTQQKHKQFVITRETNLGEVVRQYPKTAEIMLEYGLHCAGCFANAFDSVEQGAAVHGMSEEEMEEMIFRLNEEINNPLDKSEARSTKSEKISNDQK